MLPFMIAAGPASVRAEAYARQALEAEFAALHWIARGRDYEITNLYVLAAYARTTESAKYAAASGQTRDRVCELVAAESSS
jgi:hypothetical protein